MWIDALCLLAVVAFGVLGARQGVLAAAIQAGVIGGAWMLARVIGPSIGGIASGGQSDPAGVRMAVGGFLAFWLCYLVIRTGASATTRKLYEGDPPSPQSRTAAGVLSLLSGAALVLVTLSGLVLANLYAAGHAPAAWVDYDASAVGRLAKSHNLFLHEQVPRQWALERLAAEVQTDQWRSVEVTDTPVWRVLSRESAAFLLDPRILHAIQEEEWDTVQAEPGYLALVSEREIRQDLDALSW